MKTRGEREREREWKWLKRTSEETGRSREEN